VWRLVGLEVASRMNPKSPEHSNDKWRISLLGSGAVGVAMQTIQRSVERMNQLYEQGADAVRIGDHVRRWWQWVRSGLDGEDPMFAVFKPLTYAAADKLPRQVPAVPRL